MIILTINTQIMKKIIVLLGMFLGTVLAYGQSLSPTVVASAGGYFDNGSVSLSFTVGEVAVTTLTGGDMILTQGFQQPFELDITGVDDNKSVDWSVKTYPNPVADNLNIRFTIKSPQDFTVMIMDITGKKVFIKKYVEIQPGEVKEIDMQNYHPGIYMISVTSSDQKVRRVYKVQKK